MQHWYVYHSMNTMGHSYNSIGQSAAYSTKEQRKLCLNDVIWVIEGNMGNPKEFSLVDCFHYSSTDYPPIPRFILFI